MFDLHFKTRGNVIFTRVYRSHAEAFKAILRWKSQSTSHTVLVKRV